MLKVENTVFPLASSSNRVALLTGIVAGTVGKAEITEAVLKDTLRRKHKKPVVAEGMYFDSVTDAARFLVSRCVRSTNNNVYFDLVQSKMKSISRMCTQDCWEGYYWAE